MDGLQMFIIDYRSGHSLSRPRGFPYWLTGSQWNVAQLFLRRMRAQWLDASGEARDRHIHTQLGSMLTTIRSKYRFYYPLAKPTRLLWPQNAEEASKGTRHLCISYFLFKNQKRWGNIAKQPNELILRNSGQLIKEWVLHEFLTHFLALSDHKR